jgi:hypothetical protein
MKYNANPMQQYYETLPEPDENLTDEKSGAGTVPPNTSGTNGSDTNTTGTIPEKQPVTNGGT